METAQQGYNDRHGQVGILKVRIFEAVTNTVKEHKEEKMLPSECTNDSWCSGERKRHTFGKSYVQMLKKEIHSRRNHRKPVQFKRQKTQANSPSLHLKHSVFHLLQSLKRSKLRNRHDHITRVCKNK